MAENEDPIVGTGAANKPAKRNEGDDPGAALPVAGDEEPQSATGKHRRPDESADDEAGPGER